MSRTPHSLRDASRMRTPFAWWHLAMAVLAVFAMPAQAKAQTIPHIGSLVWKHVGYDSLIHRSENLQSFDHAVHGGFILASSNTHTNFAPVGRYKRGELIAMAAESDRVLRVDSVCPQGKDSQGRQSSVLTASINDSGTVVCYTCATDGVHLATYPGLEPIVDTMLRAFRMAWISNTGRYVVGLVQETFWTDAFTCVYDRLTGDTLNLIAGYGYWGPQFSSDDRFVTLDNRGTPRVFDLRNMRIHRDMHSPDEEGGVDLMSYTGHRVLFSNLYFAAVYDAETGEQLWRIETGPSPSQGTVFSADGTEVLLLRNGKFYNPNSGSGISLFRYKLPETSPSGVLRQDLQDPNSNWVSNSWYPQPTIPGRFITAMFGTGVAGMFTHEPSTGVSTTDDPFTPILYPNPTSGAVTLQVRSCGNAPWRVTLHDERGRELWTRTLPCVEAKIQFDVGTLPIGTYHVRATGASASDVATAMLIVK